MNRPTIAQLLDEGFWSAFGGGVRGAIAGAAKTLDYVAPELTQPLHNLEKGVRDVAKTTIDNFNKVYKGRADYIKDELADLGYIVHDGEKITRSGKNYVVPAYKILQYDAKGRPTEDKKPTPFLIDKHGRILRNLRHAKNHP